MDEKKIAIVTGASRGIGRATAVELAKIGYFVIINFKSNESAAQETLSLVHAVGGEAEISRFDVADSTQTKDAVKTIVEHYKNIHVLINNAGVTADGLFMLLGEDEWDSVINTSLKGFYNITKPVLREMVRKKRGSIISLFVSFCADAQSRPVELFCG